MPTKAERKRMRVLKKRIDRLKKNIMWSLSQQLAGNPKLDDRHVLGALTAALQIETNYRFVKVKYGTDEDDERRIRVGEEVVHKQVKAWGRGIVQEEAEYGYRVEFENKKSVDTKDGYISVSFLDVRRAKKKSK